MRSGGIAVEGRFRELGWSALNGKYGGKDERGEEEEDTCEALDLEVPLGCVSVGG